LDFDASEIREQVLEILHDVVKLLKGIQTVLFNSELTG
jgi:hypothetical protein